MALMTKTTHSNFVTLTVDDLTKAIRNSIKNDVRSMPEEEAKEMAQHVMNFFGYSERIIDNFLEPEDRDAFYMLEDSGLLTTEREETTLYDGREWRIHYWIFKKDKILDLVKTKGKRYDPIVEEAMSVYEEIPDDVWRITEKPEE
jgi:transcription initiation factor IIE alpha subunit